MDIELNTYLRNTAIRYTKIKERLKTQEVIRVGILVIDDKVFPYHSVIEELAKDSRFCVYIFVVPMITKSLEWISETMQRTFLNLKEKYANVFCVYDFDKKEYYEISHLMDIALFCNVYDVGVHPYYRVVNLSQKVLCVYVPYGFTGMLNYDFKGIILCLEYALFWRIYVENQKGLQATLQNPNINPNNVVAVGYTKMDTITRYHKIPSKRKKVIISPHHTMTDWKELQLSNFLTYSEFFLELPKLYPQIDFIFRPHPLVFEVLDKNPSLWNDTKENYLKKIEAIPNMSYHNADDYLDLFVQSDALIHDCGSYIAEYLYTDNPVCYMLRKDTYQHTFSSYGFEVLSHLYLAFCKENILAFIDEVVIGGKDTLCAKRINFAKEHIRFNLSSAGAALVENLKEEIFGERGGGINLPL
ncbi:CDP-glycerol glycerophosphotransferase family protein [Helicobacter sp. MIT 11-5569]|uniref:CDP-glycerol glycerophosphotransferase family protein n=1 Tax=Helicobacter sp. MIT 11-5569 TaxID=1548151 RepID=UPI0013757991|nr:CDP-glycerol glycerophosphotransferase family protein [Helicobacter sp. MIT 11-5569]